jgi:hypothetical protein
MTHKEFDNKHNFYPECGEGWLDVVDKLMGEIKEHNITIEPDQIKSKFGGLRFYYHTPFDKDGQQVYNSEDKYELLDKLIYEAEKECSKICEKCGEFICRKWGYLSIFDDNIPGLCHKCSKQINNRK